MRNGLVKEYARGIVWLRRDLRLSDNVALHLAQRSCDVVCPAFVIDPGLLRGPRMGAPLVRCFFTAVAALRAELRGLGSDLAILEDEDGGDALVRLAKRLDAGAIFFNVQLRTARDRARRQGHARVRSGGNRGARIDRPRVFRRRRSAAKGWFAL